MPTYRVWGMAHVVTVVEAVDSDDAGRMLLEADVDAPVEVVDVFDIEDIEEIDEVVENDES